MGASTICGVKPGGWAKMNAGMNIKMLVQIIVSCKNL
jgi:hypothetical protein